MREEINGLRVRLSRKSFSCLIRRRWKQEDGATDYLCGIKGIEDSKVKP